VAQERETLRISVREKDGTSLVTLAGIVDEHSDLSRLRGLTGRVVINLKGIRRLNSFGVRSWMDAMRQLAEKAEVAFVECSVAVVDQLNMIHGFLGHAVVRSFYAPMECSSCDRQSEELVDASECRALDGQVPTVACPACHRPMRVDDVEDQYTLFLREPTRVG